MKDIKSIYLRCDDHAEVLAFNRYEFENGDIDFEINIEDSYFGGDYMGIKGRFKRAWKAFFAKPICYTGVYVENAERIQTFFKECINIIDEGMGKKLSVFFSDIRSLKTRYQQVWSEDNDKVCYDVYDLQDRPEDATIDRDLFNGYQYIDAIKLGMELSKQGYVDVEVIDVPFGR